MLPRLFHIFCSSTHKRMNVQKVSDNVHVITFDISPANEFEQYVLLRSDAHHDSPYCDRDEEKRHLDMAKERNAVIIDYGDLFDMMQGPGDRRGSYSELRDEYKRSDYFNAVIDDAVNFYSPYAHNFAVFGYGNHCTGVKKRFGIDPLASLSSLLNYKNDAKTSTGGYTGYVRFAFKRNGSRVTSKLLKYDHGSGGGGVVTAGTIQAQRRAVFVNDADYICTGHVHEQWLRVFMKEVYINDKIELRPQYHICTPGYKEEYRKGIGNWHVERGAPPKPTGAFWLRFFWDNGIRQEISLAT